MSNVFTRMVRFARRTARQTWGVVTGLAGRGVHLCRTYWPWSLKKTLYYGAGLAALAGGIYLLVPSGLHVLGFTAAGIASGSIAAGIQSAAYGGLTSQPFSWFQSLGATTAPTLGAALVGGGLLAVSFLLLREGWNMT